MSGKRCDISLYSFMEYTYGQKEFFVFWLVSASSSFPTDTKLITLSIKHFVTLKNHFPISLNHKM